MTKRTSTLEQDLTDDYGDAENARRLNRMENRIGKLEARLEAMYDELGEHLADSAQNREAYARNSTANEQAALNTLAKAASATPPQGLLERAEKVLTDPDAMGVVASYISMGNLAKAADLLTDAEGRADKQDDEGALERVEGQLKEHELLASVSQLGETVANLQRGLNAVLGRLGALETRSAAPAPARTTVAKGAQFGRRQVQENDAANSAQGLQERLEAVFDSPAQVGTLSSMLQAGRVDEVRCAVEQAEVRHEAQMRKRDRRSL